MGAGGGFEAGTAIGEEISSWCMGVAMQTTALGFYTTLGVAAGLAGAIPPPSRQIVITRVNILANVPRSKAVGLLDLEFLLF